MDTTEPDGELGTDGGHGGAAGSPPPSTNLLVWVALAVICVVGGFLLLGRGGPWQVPDPKSISSPPSSPIPALPMASPGPGQRQYLGVARICGAMTDHRTKLSISFEVENVSSYDVTITSVKSVLPLGGLRPAGFTAGGDCVNPGTSPVTGLIAAERSRYFTLNFALPKNCPAAAAVLVRINFTALGFHETSLSMLESDLAVPDFDSCPKTPLRRSTDSARPPKPVT
jgi:hypothetical protein